MKRNYALFIVVIALAVCLVGCSSRNQNSGSTGNTASPDVSHGHDNDMLPGNDANEGGGAGGTSEEDGNLFDDTHNDRNDWIENDNDTQYDDNRDDPLDDMLDGVGNAVDDIGNAVGDAIDGNDNGTNQNNTTSSNGMAGENNRNR